MFTISCPTNCLFLQMSNKFRALNFSAATILPFPPSSSTGDDGVQRPNHQHQKRSLKSSYNHLCPDGQVSSQKARGHPPEGARQPDSKQCHRGFLMTGCGSWIIYISAVALNDPCMFSLAYRCWAKPKQLRYRSQCCCRMGPRVHPPTLPHQGSWNKPFLRGSPVGHHIHLSVNSLAYIFILLNIGTFYANDSPV